MKTKQFPSETFMHKYLNSQKNKYIRISILVITTMFMGTSAFASENVLVIINAVIIDGNGGVPIEKGSIMIVDGKIKSIGVDVTPPDGAVIIDANGSTVMPGLADMHTHLSYAGGSDGFDLLGYQRRLNALLYAGVTTVLDTGAILPFVRQIRQSIEAGKITGPNIYYVGPLIDSVDTRWPEISLSMVAESQAPGIVQYLKDHDVDAIKAYAKLNRSQIVALVQAGKKLGLPVIVDAWFQNGAEHHITTGLHAFAHTPGRVTDDTLKVMKEREVQIISTRAVGGVVKRALLTGDSFLDSDLIKSTTPSWMLERARRNATRALSDKQYANDNFGKDFHYKLQKNLKRIFDAGIPVVAGTDNDGLFIGEDLHFELELLVDAGLTPLEAISAATKNAAKLMNDDDTWGTLGVGKRADVLIVEGRPDKNISDTRNIKLVIKNGKVIDREKLKFNEKKDAGFRDTEFAY